MTLVVKRYEQILQGAINKVVARTDLNDITDTSGVKHVLAAWAREADQIYFQMAKLLDLFDILKATGADLDERAAEMQPTGLVRGPPTKATGTVVFHRSATSGVQTVPAGTAVKTTENIRVITSALGTIADTQQDSAPVAAVAILAGASGNVAAGTLVRFDSKPPGVDSVSNPDSFVGGSDQESDDELRFRLLAYVNSLARSHVSALEFLALGTTIDTGQRVRFAHIFEDLILRGEVILYIDDGSGTAETVETVTGEVVSAGMGGGGGDATIGGEVYLQLDNAPITEGSLVLQSDANGVLVEGTDYVVDDASSQIKLLSTSMLYATGAGVDETFTATSYDKYTGLIAAVWKVIYGVATDRANFPGARAAGVRVRIRSPQVLQQLVVGSLVVSDGTVKADAITAVKAALVTYINNLGISGNVIRAELITAAMEVPGVTNFFLTTPAADVNILDDQLARAVLSNITVV